MERGTGAPGQRAASLVETETRRERGHVVTPVRPPSPEPATCPTAQVTSYQPQTKIHMFDSKDTRGVSQCVDLAVFHLLIQPSPHFHLSKGIEDAFRTAATEVSLLAGTDEFNATELFGVGKLFLPPYVLLHTIPPSDVLTLSKAFLPSGNSVPAHS